MRPKHLDLHQHIKKSLINTLANVECVRISFHQVINQ